MRLLHYQNNKHHPITIGSYRYTNLQQTTAGSSSSQTTTVSATNPVVQQNMDVSVQYGSYALGVGSETHVKWKNDAI